MPSRSGAVARLVFIDLLGSVVWFPVWWYTTGLRRVVDAAIGAIRYRSQSFGLRIWVRNFFVPMYGQYDFAGRAVSLFMRSAVLVGRLVFLGVESVVYLFGLALWIVAPVACLLFFVFSLIQGAVHYG